MGSIKNKSIMENLKRRLLFYFLRSMLESLNFHFSGYDWLLIFMVTALGTLSAYLKDPQLKAVTATIPIPCGFAYIAVGLPMGTENAVSEFMCMLYVHIVRILHYKVKVPIVASIIAGLAFFVALGTFLHSRIPQGEAYFIGACIFDFIIGVIFFQSKSTSPACATRPRSRFTSRRPLLQVLFQGLCLSSA